MTQSIFVRFCHPSRAMAVAFAGALAAGALSCGGAGEAPTTPPPPPAAPPIPALDAPVAEAPAAKPAREEVVIHQADIHGKIKARAGKRIVVEPLVLTSPTLPVKGNKAGLYRVLEPEGGKAEMLLIADVNVATSMELGDSVALDLVDEKKDVLIAGKKTNHYVPGTKVLVRYEW
ncbi:hypothetical protein [Chondromyces apiculatus]|uniref:Lipoprotein n=1 Tax=Chondromyces apiculatus DSM 436 TaxID=1192034 RepID=A0A017TFW0_9BACT|nr:hypothetical protein [Chondromyces apiculatus]EYF07710.1 Hypothetical protein CAP_8211 [Chondromyces apiculatus DSM 436]